MDPPLKQWIATKPDLVTIEYHTSFPYVGDPFYQANIPEQQNRVSYYGITSAPSIRIDGPYAPAGFNVNAYENLYQQRRAVPALTQIELEGEYDLGTRTGTVSARLTAENALPGDWRLRIALIENDIHYPAPNGINIHEHVFRRFVADTTGTPVTFSAPYPDMVTVEHPFAVGPSWAVENVVLVAFLQEQGSRQIDQAVRQPVLDLVVGMDDGGAPPPPTQLRLEPVSPNPFQSGVEVVFESPRAGPVRLAVHDALGRTVRILFDRSHEAGRQTVAWDGRDAAGRLLPSGLYFLRLTGSGDLGSAVSQKAVLRR